MHILEGCCWWKTGSASSISTSSQFRGLCQKCQNWAELSWAQFLLSSREELCPQALLIVTKMWTDYGLRRPERAALQHMRLCAARFSWPTIALHQAACWQFHSFSGDMADSCCVSAAVLLVMHKKLRLKYTGPSKHVACLPPSTAVPVQSAWPSIAPMVTPYGLYVAARVIVAIWLLSPHSAADASSASTFGCVVCHCTGLKRWPLLSCPHRVCTAF